MTILQVTDLQFGFSAAPLFQSVSFLLNRGDRAALVAPNGAGKTTLLKLIANELSPDRGSIHIPKGITWSFFRQSSEDKLHGTVLDMFLEHFGSVVSLRKELLIAQELASTGNPLDLEHLALLMDKYHQLGGDDLERRILMIAEHLGFSEKDFSRDVHSLSGGERGRLMLGSILAQPVDLLLLDEPTNHLDMETIEWLENMLKSTSSAILCVSHDRAFLDSVCPMTFELGQRNFRSYPLSYSAYVKAREEDLEREEILAERQDAFVNKTEEFIRKNLAGQKTKQAKSRRKMLEKLDVVERPEDVWQKAGRLQFRFQEVPRSGDVVLKVERVSATLIDRTLFSNIEFLLKRGDKLGIVGPNGCGKSTLLRILALVDPHKSPGRIERGAQLVEGYFDQHLGSLDPNKNAIEEIRTLRPDMSQETIRGYLGQFRFYNDMTLRPISGFSGGEKSRLSLAKLLLEPINFLFLDEPTNHLDLFAVETLEQALVNFPGTLVLVSHDRKLLEKVTTRLLVFEGDKVAMFPGNWKEYCNHKNVQKNHFSDVESSKSNLNTFKPSVGKNSYLEKKAFFKALEKKQKRFKELENLVHKNEVELKTLREESEKILEENWTQWEARSKREQLLAKQIEEAMIEWMELDQELNSETRRGEE